MVFHKRFPFLEINLDTLDNSFQLRGVVFSCTQEVPTGLTDKGGVGIGEFGLLGSASDQMVPVRKVDGVALSSDGCADQKGVNFFVRFEKSPANVSEHQFRDTVHDIANPLLQDT